MDKPNPKTVRVTVTDPESGEVLHERTITNDYAVVCSGDRYIKNLQIMGSTHMLAIAREKSNG